MLIADINTLKSVNALYFFYKIVSYRFNSLDFKEIMRIDGSVGNSVAGFNYIAVFNYKLRTVRYEIGSGISVYIIRDNNLALLLIVAELNLSGNFRNNCKSLGLTCLKKLFNTRKT